MGTLTIDTGFDLSGAEKGYKRLEQITKKTAREAADEISGIGGSFDSVSAAIIKQQAEVDELKRKYDSLATGEAVPKELTALETQLKKSQIEVEKLAAEFEKLAQEKAVLEERAVTVEGTPYASAADTARLSEISLKMDEIAPKWEKAEVSAADYQARIERIRENPLDTEEGIKIANSLSVANQKLDEMKAKSSQVGSAAPKAMTITEKATNSLSNSLEKTATRIKRLLSAALIYNVLRSSFRSLREYIGLAIKDNQAFANSWSQVKGNLQTAFQPVLQSVIPILAQLISWLATATQYLVRFISVLTGKSIKSMQDSAKAMNSLGASTKKTGSAAKAANKEAQKMLGTFDEINQVAKEAEDTDADGAGAAADATGISPQYGEMDELTSKMRDTIAAITILLGGALVVVGAILVFTGANIPLGLGLMAVGGYVLGAAIAANWATMSSEIKNTIRNITAILSGALLVVGAILTFTGANVPLGIALMALGAIGLAAAAAVAWGGLSEDIKSTITTIATILSGALLVVGAILVFTGVNIPIGIALMSLGAIGLAAAAALKWGSMSDEIKQVITVIMIALTAALLVIGVILAFTGAALPLGLGLMVAGAITLGRAIATSSALTDEVRQTITTIMGIAGLAATALGIVLLCFGQIPLGLALLVSGVGLMYTGIFASPGKDMLEKIKTFVNGIIGFFEGMANGVITIFERLVNWIITAINKISFTLPDILGGAKIGFNIPSVALGRVAIPRLATGTVVPPNKEFMAILGDNKQEPEVVSPLSTIEEAVENALDRRGATGGDVTIVMEVDGRTLGRVVLPWSDVEKARQGGRISNRLVTT